MDTVQIWQMQQGKITQMKIAGGVFVVNPNLPADLDPVEIATNFLKVFSVERTKIIRKVEVPPTKPTTIENLIVVGKYNSVSMYQEIIIKLYKEFTEFNTKQAFTFFKSCYPELRDDTIKNRQGAYIHFLKNKGFLIAARKEGRTVTYTFLQAPYGAVRPSTVEYDKEYTQDLKLRELEMIRKEL